MDFFFPTHPEHGRDAEIAELDVTLGVEHDVFRFDVAVSDAHRVQVSDARKDLLKVRVDLGRRHVALLDRCVQVAARTVLHHFAPVLMFVLNEVDRLDNVFVVQRRRNTKLGRQLLDVFLLGLVLSALSEFLSVRTPISIYPCSIVQRDSP